MKSIEDFHIPENRNFAGAKKAYKAYLRVEISAMAMQGLLSGEYSKMVDAESDTEIVSEVAINYADELIKQLKI